MSKNENIKKAEKELEYLTGDEEVKRLAYLREKAIRDEMAAMTRAKREGESSKAIEIAKKMLSKGMEIEVIIEITGLSKEEIENL